MAKPILKPSDFNPSEDAEQEAVMNWAAWSPYRKQLKWLYHCPNGGHRSGAEAARFKRLGVKSGVADLCLPLPRGRYHGLYIEMKRRKGGVISDNQADFLRDMINAGYAARVAYGSDEAVSIITDYLEGRLRDESYEGERTVSEPEGAGGDMAAETAPGSRDEPAGAGGGGEKVGE
jgi:hypothetical protein